MDVGSTLSGINGSQTLNSAQSQVGFNAPLASVSNPALPGDQLNQNQNQDPSLQRYARQYEDAGMMISSYQAPDAGRNKTAPKIRNPGEVVAVSTMAIDGLFLAAMVTLFFGLAFAKGRGRPRSLSHNPQPNSANQKHITREIEEQYNSKLATSNAKGNFHEPPAPVKSATKGGRA